ncbi:hypothetical protein VNO77_20195 [Canavalia gladiata]|uniref:Uncharacterized protein n=1 Tax=Canavalia gladiata TaxID=3824 RepID=A0AAN9LSR8_CANGL
MGGSGELELWLKSLKKHLAKEKALQKLLLKGSIEAALENSDWLCRCWRREDRMSFEWNLHTDSTTVGSSLVVFSVNSRHNFVSKPVQCRKRIPVVFYPNNSHTAKMHNVPLSKYQRS